MSVSSRCTNLASFDTKVKAARASYFNWLIDVGRNNPWFLFFISDHLLNDTPSEASSFYSFHRYRCIDSVILDQFAPISLNTLIDPVVQYC